MCFPYRLGPDSAQLRGRILFIPSFPLHPRALRGLGAEHDILVMSQRSYSVPRRMPLHYGPQDIKRRIVQQVPPPPPPLLNTQTRPWATLQKRTKSPRFSQMGWKAIHALTPSTQPPRPLSACHSPPKFASKSEEYFNLLTEFLSGDLDKATFDVQINNLLSDGQRTNQLCRRE